MNLSGIVALIVGIMLVIICHVIKNRKKEIVFHRIFSLIMLLLIVIHVVFYWIDFKNYTSAIESISIEEIDLNQIPDGEYYGEYDAGYIYAKVCVYVSNHEIQNIRLLEHENERGSAASDITKSIVLYQKLDVDAVSGATNSSKVIKKACENALRNR